MHQRKRSRPLSRPRARVDLRSQALLVFLGSTSVAMHRSQWLILLSTETRRMCVISDSPRSGAREGCDVMTATNGCKALAWEVS